MTQLQLVLVASALAALAWTGDGQCAANSTNQPEPRLQKVGQFALVHDLSDLYYRLPNVGLNGAPLWTSVSDKEGPEGAQCISLLNAFIVMGHRLRFITDIIRLDACLGYLYDDSFSRWEDNDSEAKLALNRLIRHSKLRAIYRGTQLGQELSADGSQCLRRLLLESIRLEQQQTCDRQWAALFTSYAQCRWLLPEASHDSYVALINDQVGKYGRNCFLELTTKLNNEVEAWYQHDTSHRLARTLRKGVCVSTPADDQLSQLHWPTRMLRVLQVVAGVPKTMQVSVDDVSALLHDLAQHHHTEVFTRNLATYANSEINLGNNQNDAEGHQRYQEAIERLCTPFRSHSRPDSRHIDFNRLIMELLVMTFHKDLFHVDQDTFLAALKERGQLALPLYAAVYSCRYMASTVGTINRTGSVPYYEVRLSDHADSTMELWPFN